MRTRILLLSPLALSLLLFPSTLAAQTQAELIDKRDGKLRLPFLDKVDWERTMAAAKVRAQREGKFVFAYFTRSDEHCAGSILMECGPLSSPGFVEFAKRVVPLCHITTRVEGDPEQDLHRRMGGITFPWVVICDARGKILYRVPGDHLEDFEKGLAELDEEKALEARVKAKDRDAPYLLLKKRLELRHIEWPAAKKALRGMRRLTNLEKAELEPLLLRAEVHHIVEGIDRDDRQGMARAGTKMLRLYEDDLRPPPGDAVFPYWWALLAYAGERRDAALYETALDILKREFPKMEFPDEDRTLRQLQTEK